MYIMKLHDLVEKLDYQLLRGDVNVEITGVTSDSRKVVEGGLFIAIRGAVSDGHEFLEMALQKGAAAFIIEDESFADKIPAGRTVILTSNTRLALALVSAAYFGNPAEKLFTIGITGTKGKTTTTYMIKNVLESCGIKTGLIGTIETIIGEDSFPAKNTTPESIQIHESFTKMVDTGCKAVVMEVSSQGLKLDRTAGIMFDIGVFTNLALDHVGPDEHDSFEDYLECKSRLFRQCRLGIVNGDDEHVDEILRNSTCKVERYGLNENNDLYAGDINHFHERGKIGLKYRCSGLWNFDVEVHMPGLFTVYNSLCAIAVTRHLSNNINNAENKDIADASHCVDEEHLKKALLSVRVKGRMELVKVSQNFSLMIDYAHNAMALQSILEDLRQYNPHRLVCVFGCGGNRSKDRRYEMGKVSGELADFTIITSDNPRFENPEDIMADIESSLVKTGGKYVKITDRAEAVKYAIRNGEPGDIIIVAGKGHEDYQEIKGVRYPMDERTLVADAVKELKEEGIEGLI
jgi:UDP-N-acetylmuramoyl-L-alanyl-D-glutamate--2,6-diaminopimelate ligase